MAFALMLLWVVSVQPAQAQGDGLNGGYWNFNVIANGNLFPSSAPDRTRIDPTVNFDWGSGAPAPGIGGDDFAVRWDGMVEAPQTGAYIFSTQSDDGVRLWINGALVIDNWTLHGPTWNDSATINLVAGQRYVVRMEMFERGGGAVARLYWRKPSDISAGSPRNVVPQQYLFSQATPTVLAVVQSCTDLKTLSVSFSRPMQGGKGKDSVERKQNYDIIGSLPKGLTVQSAVLESDGQTVTLTLNKALIAGNSYTLRIEDVVASDGVLIDPNPTLFIFTAGAGNGLMASFWNFDVASNGNAFPTGPAAVVRQDAQVDFDWAAGSPSAGVGADSFAVRWEGFVEAPVTGNYTFWTQSDDGVRLWVNGNQVINNWTLHSATWDSAAPVALQAGQRYAVRMEMFERGGDAVARLHWQTPGSATRVAVPSSQLFGCPGGVTIDHVRLLHPGVGLTCAAADITVLACANADCSVLVNEAITVDLLASPGGVYSTNPVVLNSGSAVVQLRQTAPGVVTLNAASRAPLATALTRCFAGALETCQLDFRDSGFVFDVPTQTACKTSTDVVIRAVRTDDTTQTCAPAFTGTRTLNFWTDYMSPASGTQQALVNATPVATTAPGTAIDLTFDANAEATFTVNYPDAGQLNLHARHVGAGSEDGLILDGADLFVSRPAGLAVFSPAAPAGCPAADADCPLFAKAGADFPLTVQAACWDSDGDSDFSDNPVTPNFQQTPITLSAALLAPSPGFAGTLAIANTGIAAADAGTVTLNQQYSEVGVIRIDANAGNYLGTGDLLGSTPPLGRFSPDHFALAATPNITDRSSTPACLGPPDSPFTYMDELFQLDFTLQAMNAGGTVTRNYEGLFARLVPSVATDLGLAAGSGGDDLTARLNTPASGNWSAGEAVLTAGLRFARTNPPDGPYPLDLGLAPADSDGVQLLPTDINLDIDGDTIPEHFNAGSTELRHGRLALYNAIGSELQPLVVGLQAEYFNGSGFVLNTADTCTPLDLASELLLQNPDTAGGEQPGDTVMTVAAGTSRATLVNMPPPVQGRINVSLTPPGAGNTGFIDLRAALGASLPWLQFDWDGDGLYDNDPRGRGTFGVFAGPESMIDMR
ncbi:MAG: PA14 domain-containing protein [Xanthomonadaceae bacterium]|nr:PA14 domain-containing protein [Xanthomonadaceae bacterium]